MSEKDELERLWSSQTAGPPTKGEDMLNIAIRKADQFDRMIRRRNVVECIAAAFVAVFFAIMAVRAPNALARAGNAVVAASGLWIIYYFARHGREARDPAPDQTLAGFQRALLGKYEHQIRLLKSVKYWYLLPPYAGLLLMSAGLILQNRHVARLGWADFILPVTYTAVYAGVWWFNEVAGVGWLMRQRARLLESMRGLEGDQCES